MRLLNVLLTFTFIGLFISLTTAQNSAKITGKVIDENRQVLPLVNVSIAGQSGGTSTDDYGNYSINLPVNEKLMLIFSFIGFKTDSVEVLLKENQDRVINVTLFSKAKELSDVIIEDKEVRKSTLTRIDPQSALKIPTVTGGIEALVK
jgi:hypothetical protein